MNLYTLVEVNWSKYQQAIFDDARDGQGHTVIVARAGAAKTSSLIESLNHAPRDETKLLCAFNKIIQRELAQRAPRGVDVRTLHSLGLLAVTKAWGRVQVDNRRVDGLMVMALPDSADMPTRIGVKKLVSLAKNLWLHDEKELIDASFEFDVHPGVLSREQLVKYAMAVLEMSKQTYDRAVDFDDMTWLPSELKMPVPQFDMVFVDEAQDLSPVQLHLARQACGRNGRIVMTGDDRQAIYSWRGADEEAIPRMLTELNARKLTLPISYRCPRSVVELAQKTVPDFEPWSEAKDGVVQDVSENAIYRDAQPGDFILSRTNAPLMPICLRLLRDGKRAVIQGKDVGSHISSLIRRSRTDTIPDFISWLSNYRAREIMNLIAAKASESAIEAVHDKCETILALTEGCRKTTELAERVLNLFDDAVGEKYIILSTVHRAKGLESNTIWLLMKTFKWDSVAEENIWYVAVTRSKDTLNLVVASR